MGAAQNLKPWAKGVSGNPSGRAKLSPELRAIKALTREEASRYIAKYARMSAQDLEAIILARSAPMLELTIARIFQEAEKKGDERKLSFLLEQALGKVPTVEPTAEEADVMREIQELSDQELVRLVKEKLPEIEKPESLKRET